MTEPRGSHLLMQPNVATAVKLTQYVDRAEAILTRCRGRRVLHLGCVGFTDCSAAQKIALAPQTLHHKLSQECECVGVDIDRQTVEDLKAAGLCSNIVVGDAERLGDLQLAPFDIVLAGDIIEHLSNPGLMLRGARQLLKPGGRLIVSTPNSMGLPAYLRYLRGSFREGQQHVLCFNAINLTQLLQREGYQVVESLSCHQAPQPGNAFRIGSAFFRRFPNLGGTLFFVAGSAAESRL